MLQEQNVRTRMRLVITLVGLGKMRSIWNRRVSPVGKMLDGCPVRVFADGAINWIRKRSSR